MITTESKKIIITENDFGLYLPITITGAEIERNDTISFVIKDLKGNEKIKKTFTNISNNEFEFFLTEEESLSLGNGYYIYQIDWYRNEVFMANIINCEAFIVEKKV